MTDERAGGERDAPMRRLFALVVILEILVVFGLWLAGRYFGG